MKSGYYCVGFVKSSYICTCLSIQRVEQASRPGVQEYFSGLAFIRSSNKTSIRSKYLINL